MPDTYLTIESKGEGLYKEKGSKFIALAYPVTTEEEIKPILANLRKEYHDARHYCYAYQLGADKKKFRANDDGEPTNSAGQPILGQIKSNNLTNVVVIVIRYFGGKLLGVSGLINAYKTAAADALSNTKIITKTIRDLYELTFAYTIINNVMRLIEEEKLTIVKQTFEADCTIRIGVRLSKSEAIKKRIEKSPEVTIKYIGRE
ncbi:MAG: YigZ family protein [Bacteroidales bacterium]|nr:YigZ family protein [Bacteroidales bacterium]